MVLYDFAGTLRIEELWASIITYPTIAVVLSSTVLALALWRTWRFTISPILYPTIQKSFHTGYLFNKTLFMSFTLETDTASVVVGNDFDVPNPRILVLMLVKVTQSRSSTILINFLLARGTRTDLHPVVLLC